MNDGTGHRVPYPQETRHNTSFQRIDPFQHRQAFLQRRLPKGTYTYIERTTFLKTPPPHHPKGKTMYLAYFAVTVVGHYVLALDAQIRWDIQNEWRNTLRTVCSYYTAHSDREYICPLLS